MAMESARQADAPPPKAGLAAELRQTVREEHKQLQGWLTAWGKHQEQLLVAHSQLLYHVVERQGSKPPPIPQDHASFRARRVCQHSRPLGTRRAGTLGSLSKEGGDDNAEGDASEFVGVMPTFLPATDPVQLSLSDLPNVIGVSETVWDAEDARSETAPSVVSDLKATGRQGRPIFQHATSCDSLMSVGEEARDQWSRHLRRCVSMQLNEEEERRRSFSSPRLPRWMIGWMQCRAEASNWAISRFVRTNFFQSYCVGVVVVNMVVMGYTTDMSIGLALETPPARAPTWFETANRVFTALYCVELIFRVVAFGKEFCTGPDRRWHAFDTVLVLTSLAEEMVQGVELNVTSLNALRVLGMFRVLRIIRVMRYFRDVRLMVSSIMQSLWSLTCALVLLFIIMFLFTVVFAQGVILYLTQAEATAEVDTIRDGVVLWYGSLFGTMYTLLASIVGGVDWMDVVRPLEHISMVYRFLYSFYIIFVVIGVLNVLTGIFVERAGELSGLDRDLVIQNQLTRDEQFLFEMKRIFEEADADGSGTISWDEFKMYLENSRVKAYLSTKQLDAFDARTLFDMISEGNEDEIPMEAFIAGCQRIKGQAKGVDLVAVLQETRALNRKLKVVMRRLESMNMSAVATLDDFRSYSRSSDV